MKRLMLCLVLLAILIPIPANAASGTIIPDSAWTRPIGEPYSGAGHSAVNYPIIDDGPVQGAPLGGIGAGTVGRTYAGDFARWHLNIGKHQYRSRLVDMFSVYVKEGDQSSAQALYTGAPTDGTLGAWKWNYPVGQGTYWALYPRSGFVYDGLPIKLSVEQYSPVIPNDYEASSYPVAIFNYTASNPGTQPVTVGVMFTWQNMLGADETAWWKAGLTSKVQRAGDTLGIVFGRKEPFSGAEWDGSMAIGVQGGSGITLGAFTEFKANGDGADIWNDFAADDKLDDTRESGENRARSALGAGVSATITLQPGQTMQVPFFLTWDQPVMTFGATDNGESWYKRYTTFFGHDGAQAWNILQRAVEKREAWHQALLDWQTPILDDKNLPSWFKTALFNELYYIVDGGTAWTAGRVAADGAESKEQHFAMLECFDYLFYSTFDVDFYASYALMQLWPDLEKLTIDEFAATVPQENLTKFTVGANHQQGVRKIKFAVPHDLGSPQESPWTLPNAYTWQDVNRWKDLNAKFVLRLYRDTVLLKEPELAKKNFQAVKDAMAYLASLDKNGIGIPENEGIPDQTYDAWPATGVSAYSGGLWLAALRASAEMAKIAGDADAQKDYEARLAKAQKVYEDALWTGTYYAYDASSNANHDSIMADQLAGQWYLDYTGQTVLPADHVMSALKTIYAKNVAGFADGKMGAVNGARPDGSIDMSSDQSQEVWTGTTYAVAALMLKRGLRDEAWATAFGVYHMVYERGYWFRTPEAYLKNGNFRASMYMRPLSIWAIELAYKMS